MKLKKSAVAATLLSLVIGFFSGTGFKLIYELNAFQPYEWAVTDPPIILNCYGKEFSKLQMVRAIEYWALRGHHIGFYEHDPPSELCEEEWREGFIILRKVNSLSPGSTLAATKRYTSGFRIRGAQIQYTPGAFNLRLINEHELGHALGFGHVDKEGHVMHPHFGKMGRDFYIP